LRESAFRRFIFYFLLLKMDPFVVRLPNGKCYRQTERIERGPPVSLLGSGLPDDLIYKCGDLSAPLPIINRVTPDDWTSGSIELSEDLKTVSLHISKTLFPFSYRLSVETYVLPPSVENIVIFSLRTGCEHGIYFAHQLLHKRQIDHEASVLDRLNKLGLDLNTFLERLERDKCSKVTLYVRYANISYGTIARLWVLAQSGMLYSIVLDEVRLVGNIGEHWTAMCKACFDCGVYIKVTGTFDTHVIECGNADGSIDYTVTSTSVDINFGPCRSLTIEIDCNVDLVQFFNRHDRGYQPHTDNLSNRVCNTVVVTVDRFDTLEIIIHSDITTNIVSFLLSLAQTYTGHIPAVSLVFKPRHDPTHVHLNTRTRQLDERVRDRVSKCIANIEKITQHFAQNVGRFDQTSALLLSNVPPLSGVFSQWEPHIAPKYEELLSTNDAAFLASTLYRLMREGFDGVQYPETTLLRDWLNARFELDMTVMNSVIAMYMKPVSNTKDPELVDIRKTICEYAEVHQSQLEQYTLVLAHYIKPTSMRRVSLINIRRIICEYVGFSIEQQKYTASLLRYAVAGKCTQVARLPSMPATRRRAVAPARVSRTGNSKSVINLTVEDGEKRADPPRADGKESASDSEPEDEATQQESYDGDSLYKQRYPGDIHWENFRNGEYKRKRKRSERR